MRRNRLAILVGAALLAACGGVSEDEHARLEIEVKSLRNDLTVTQRKLADAEKQVQNEKARSQIANDRLAFLAQKINGVKARIKTTMGDIETQFFPDKAPIHCFNFIARAESGFYDETLFHRVMKGFMIQGGDPLSKDDNPANDGSGGPIVNIPHEFNDIKHIPGILSMARVGDKSQGAGTQFFVMHADYPSLNGQYTVFGKVTKGMDVVNKIATTPTKKPGDRPLKDVRIKSIEVYR